MYPKSRKISAFGKENTKSGCEVKRYIFVTGNKQNSVAILYKMYFLLKLVENQKNKFCKILAFFTQTTKILDLQPTYLVSTDIIVQVNTEGHGFDCLV